MLIRSAVLVFVTLATLSEVAPSAFAESLVEFSGSYDPSSSTLQFTDLIIQLLDGTIIGPEGPFSVPVSGSFQGSAILDGTSVSGLDFSSQLSGPSFPILGGLADTGAFTSMQSTALGASFSSLSLDPSFPNPGSTGSFMAQVNDILTFENVSFNGEPFLGPETIDGILSTNADGTIDVRISDSRTIEAEGSVERPVIVKLPDGTTIQALSLRMIETSDKHGVATVRITPIPEPSTLGSAGIAALLGLGYAWRRCRRVAS
ncbi:MAG: PEP-CTERM sorting domain-containing protein [Isosphaeraceae bacterium]|nr:PEP-CTERM sorting domain-containing protein [Isosphaeraceae bacterium]